MTTVRTVRVEPGLLDAVRACAARGHRRLADAAGTSMRGRPGRVVAGLALSAPQGSIRGE